MTDCTGYGFGAEIDLCLQGAVGNGRKSTLKIVINSITNNNFNPNPLTLTIDNWDGLETEIDLSSYLSGTGYEYLGCNDVTSKMTITPKTPTSGTLIMEFSLRNCTSAPGACSGAEPYVVSEMRSFKFNQPACT